MTQIAENASHKTEHLTQEIHQLEGRLHQTDPRQDPTLYRSLYCKISLRQMQLLANTSQQTGQHHHAS